MGVGLKQILPAVLAERIATNALLRNQQNYEEKLLINDSKITGIMLIQSLIVLTTIILLESNYTTSCMMFLNVSVTLA